MDSVEKVLAQAQDVRSGEAGADWDGDWAHQWADVIVSLAARAEQAEKDAEGSKFLRELADANANKYAARAERYREALETFLGRYEESLTDNRTDADTVFVLLAHLRELRRALSDSLTEGEER